MRLLVRNQCQILCKTRTNVSRETSTDAGQMFHVEHLDSYDAFLRIESPRKEGGGIVLGVLRLRSCSAQDDSGREDAGNVGIDLRLCFT
jgi:hypothetical protein